MSKNLENSESGMKQHIDCKSTVLDMGDAEQPKLLPMEDLSYLCISAWPSLPEMQCLLWPVVLHIWGQS